MPNLRLTILAVITGIATSHSISPIRVAHPRFTKSRATAIESQNAFDILQSAAAGLTDGERINNASSVAPDEYSHAELAGIVQSNKAAIELTLSALKHRYHSPIAGIVESTAPPYSAQFQSLAQLMELDARLKDADGDYTGAVNRRLDIIRLGEMLQGHTSYGGCLAGAACGTIALHNIWDDIAHLTPGQSEYGAIQLEGIIDTHVPFADTIANENTALRVILEKSFRSGDPVQFFEAADPDLKTDGDEIEIAVSEMKRAGETATLRDADDAAATILQLNSAAWQTSDNTPSPFGKMMITHLLYTSRATNVRYKVLYVEEGLRLLETQFAIHAYAGDNGKLPEVLADLVPRYLKAVPSDVFTANDTVRYGRSDDQAVVYSVGPDGIDDSGTPAHDPGDAQRSTVAPGMDATGDLVGGVSY